MLSFQLAALHFRVQTKPHSTFLSLSLLFYLSRYSSFTLFRPSSIWDLELLGPFVLPFLLLGPSLFLQTGLDECELYPVSLISAEYALIFQIYPKLYADGLSFE